MPTNEAVARLGEAVRTRRGELQMSQADVTKAGGPSDTTQSKIELGIAQKVGTQTLAKYDIAFGWPAGRAHSILVGADYHGAETRVPDMTFSPAPTERVVRAPRADRAGVVPPSLAVALAVAIEYADATLEALDDLRWDPEKPEAFDGEAFEDARFTVRVALDEVAAIAAGIAERAVGGRGHLEVAVQNYKDKAEQRRRTLQASYEEAHGLAPVAGKPEGLPANERQADYDLAGGWAARTVPGPTDAEKRHAAQDAAAEAPDEDGPDAGA